MGPWYLKKIGTFNSPEAARCSRYMSMLGRIKLRRANRPSLTRDKKPSPVGVLALAGKQFVSFVAGTSVDSPELLWVQDKERLRGNKTNTFHIPHHHSQHLGPYSKHNACLYHPSHTPIQRHFNCTFSIADDDVTGLGFNPTYEGGENPTGRIRAIFCRNHTPHATPSSN